MQSFIGLRKIPLPLRIIFLIFFLVPFFSFSYLAKEILGACRGEYGIIALLAVTYILLPFLLCFSILWKHFWFLPLYFLQCLFLFFHSLLFTHSVPFDLLTLRYAMIGLMAYVGFLLSEKDILYPFMSRHHRLWRRFPRVALAYDIELSWAQNDRRYPALMENISETGIAARLDAKYRHAFETEVSESNAFVTVHLRWLGKEEAVEAKVTRAVGHDSITLGLNAKKHRAFGPFFQWASHEPSYKPSRMRRGREQFHLSHTAIVIWGLFIVISFAMPLLAI